jgi:hypothetical protein
MSTPERYEQAWNYIWESYNNWQKTIITDEPDTRQGKEFSKKFGYEVAILAESDKKIPLTETNRVTNKPKAAAKLHPSGIKE